MGEANPLWSKIVTIILVVATFVVFFVLIWPFIISYFKYYHSGFLPSSQETLSVVSLPDVANITEENVASGSKAKNQSIDFYIKTPTLEISAPIVEGVSQEALYHGIGHHPGTPWPADQKGNVILVGHSSWIDPANPYGFVFKNLNRLNLGDEIQIKYLDKIYHYQVMGKYLINPDDTSLFTQHVIKPTLTVYTCSPVYTNWKRLVYVAELR